MTDKHNTTPPQETQLSSEQILAVADGFIKHFEVEIDPNEDKQGFIDAIKKLDPLKTGDPRYVNENNPTQYNAETEKIIRDTFDAMGMSNLETPLAPGHYDAILVLGAARQAPLDRLDYLLKAQQSGAITTDAIIVTGSARPLGKDADPTKDETVIVSNYAPGAQTEGNLASAVAAGAAHDTTLPENMVFASINDFVGINPENGRKFYADNDKTMTQALEELIARGVVLDENSRIGAVTTQIYAPGAKFDLAKVAAKFGVTDTFMAGNPSDPKIIAARKVPTLETEVCRTIEKALA